MRMKEQILVIDSNESDRDIIKRILSDKYDIIESDNGTDGFEVFCKKYSEFSAVIINMDIDDSHGWNYFMKRYNGYGEYKKIPVVAFFPADMEEIEKICLDYGIDDFMSKPIDPDILRFRINFALCRSKEASLIKFKHLANFDPVTNIYNFRKFKDDMAIMLKENMDTKFMICRFEINNFKLINHIFGYDEGDKLLKRIAEHLIKVYGGKEKTVFGYLGADIFAICMPCIENKRIISEIKAYRSAFANYPLNFEIVPNYGIYKIEDNNSIINEILDKAKMAANKCKGSYVKNYAFYSEDLRKEILQEQDIINRMNNALEQGEFVIYLQPKYVLRTETPVGAEVLVRWIDPRLGQISPGVFIPIFERNGFITRLDYFIWERACELLRRWIDEGNEPYPISVNISRVSFHNPKLNEILQNLVERYQIPAKMLELEITESAYSSDPKAVQMMVEKLQRYGFTVLMDDFGSGYSSLNTLKDLKVDILKMDLEFLSDCKDRERAECILASIIRMAKWLNLPVIAEGVEKESQVMLLKSLGCEYVQGYYFARPMPVQEYEELVFSEDSSSMEKDSLDSLGSSSYEGKSLLETEVLLSNIMQSIAMYDYSNGHIETIRVNKAFYDLYGYSTLNDSMEAIYPLDDVQRRKIINAFDTVAENRNASECTYARKNTNNRPQWINIKLKYMYSVGNSDIIFATMVDITEQVNLDIEISKYRRALSMTGESMKGVLVVDGTESSRMDIRDIISDNYRVFESTDNKGVREILAREDIDVILLNLTMEEDEAVLSMRKTDPLFSGIPVIVITDDVSIEHRMRIMNMGANEYILKPLIPEVVLRRINSVLETSRSLGNKLRNNKDIE